MPDEVLLDDFEDTGKWELAGAGASKAHITTFAEGAPVKDPGVYADGERGEDHRALAVLVRGAADGHEIELVAKAGQVFALPGEVSGLDLYVRSPHASIEVSGFVAAAGQDSVEVLLGRIAATPEWQRIGEKLPAALTGAELLGIKIRLTEVVKSAGEVMILLDDLTVRSSA
ncbi:hypothetical protein ACFVUS_11460 [Nocardia sp. NPDC058058]|uniref:hypothetical protein n=1 Tax=Nocardia sp. NPDC058058 TaxID=3346317 RepID=UPI0036D9B6CC